MFAANAKLDARAGLATAFGGQLDQFAHTLDIDADEWIAGEDALVDIGAEEPACIVAANADRRLGQIVGAEGEEFADFRDFPGLDLLDPGDTPPPDYYLYVPEDADSHWSYDTHIQVRLPRNVPLVDAMESAQDIRLGVGR